MAHPLTLIETSPVDFAWEKYRKLAAAVSDDPRLLADRAYMERMASAERAWKALFLSEKS